MINRLAFVLFLSWTVLLVGASNGPARSDDCLRIAFYTEMPGGEPLARALAGVYRTIGECTTVVDMPLARAGQLIISGELDADIARTQAFIDNANGAVTAVPTPIFSLDILAITLKESGYSPQTSDEIVGKNIGVKSGVHWATEFEDRNQIMEVHQTVQLLNMVERGRLQVALIDKATLNILIRLGHAPSDRLLVSSPIVSFPIYHVVNARHAALVPRLDVALKDIQSAGLIEKTIEQWFERQLAETGPTNTAKP